MNARMLNLRLCVLLVLLLAAAQAQGQHVLNVLLNDSASQEPLAGVVVQVLGTSSGAVTDADGAATVRNIPEGAQVVQFSLSGYRERTISLNFPVPDGTLGVYLAAVETELDEIVVEGTRSNKSISAVPTRVEVLTEEIDEASTMDPSKIAHLITHSTGIQVQQTSAASNTANVRIQGLDGRYTQILKDGFPLYGGFSGSLSIMQIPPLDLRQVEYIKGGASTLYGGGAISGLINLISKDPDKEETLLHLNASHIGALDVNAFMSRRMGKLGFTLLAQRNTHRAFDADKDGYSDMPQLTKYNINPKLFFYPGLRTKIAVGATLTNEERQGGDMGLMDGQVVLPGKYYYEKNEVERVTTTFKLEHRFNDRHTLAVRNSFNFFHREMSLSNTVLLPPYRFGGRQLASFSEVSHTIRGQRHLLIAGLNGYTDRFRETPLGAQSLRDEATQTVGAFANYNGELGKLLSVEAGFRGDYVLNQRFMPLPRVSMLFKWSRKLTTRIGGGMGYRNPTVFNQEAEIRAYDRVLPISASPVEAERSLGGNADIGYKTTFGEHYFLNINQMFFFTRIDGPLVLVPTGSGSGTFAFVNANGYTQSYGAETFFKFGFYDFVFFAGYTYTHATNMYSGLENAVTLTPAHSLKGDLLYALPGKWRIGLDYEYKSAQPLSNGSKSPDFWTFGAVVEYTKDQVTLFGNVENYTNVRQTKYGSLLSAPSNTPQFTEVWAPLDGIVFNAGIKLRL